MNLKYNSEEIAQKSLRFLQSVVAIESSSDENSDTIPSTPGQAELGNYLEEFFAGLGASVEREEHANVIATFAGRGEFAEAEPLAMMVHLDTARGTMPLEKLDIVKAWDGESIPYSGNPDLAVSVENYPTIAMYLGQDIVFGPGTAPFGLDDKLGLAHLMTLAWLLHDHPELGHPPLILIARPDEEIGRMEALLGIADLLKERGVRSGYTIDGLDPYEINVENFNAAHASVWFEGDTLWPSGKFARVFLGGVNTHGATAKAEGHRPATRFAAEILKNLPSHATLVWILSDELRDCDAEAYFSIGEDVSELEALVASVVAPHVPRGASYRTDVVHGLPDAHGGAEAAVRWILEFLESSPGFTLSAEDSEGHDGYSQPYRIAVEPDGRFRVDVRIRDFTPEKLEERIAHVVAIAGELPNENHHQYVNMGPRLADRPELIDWARKAADRLGHKSQVQPIRGGTGVDPFLDRGVAVANVGTGYFAPESEKEFTTLQNMSGHALWLLELIQESAR